MTFLTVPGTRARDTVAGNTATRLPDFSFLLPAAGTSRTAVEISSASSRLAVLSLESLSTNL